MNTKDNSEPSYRLGVGIMLLNSSGKVFVGNRIDQNSSDAWQMPQGGIDEGETPLEAAYRELLEEVGTDNVTLLKESVDWYFYDIPKEISSKLWGGKYTGQMQKWFLFLFNGEDNQINISTEIPEFRAWKWESPNAIVNMIVDFKRDLYQSVLNEFAPIINKLDD